MKKIIENIVIPCIIVISSILLGIVFNDYKLGLITLIAGFLNAYYAAIGKWYNYIYGIIFCITYSIACYLNGLYGAAIFNLAIYIPIQIYGIINWRKKDDENNIVKVKALSLKYGLLLTLFICSGSALLGYLFDMIPTQNLSYLDSTSQFINIGAIILNTLAFTEGWYVGLANNVIDLIIWIINFKHGTIHSEMMLVVSIIYLVMNIYGIVNWVLIKKKQSNIYK